METLMSDYETDINVELDFINAIKLMIKIGSYSYGYSCISSSWLGLGALSRKIPRCYKIDSIVKSRPFL